MSTFCARDECNKKTIPECNSESACRVPWHFKVHREGFHFESCCGVCNLFPGVITIAVIKVLCGMVALILLLTHADMYDNLFESCLKYRAMSVLTGAILTAVIGAGFLLLFVAFTENGKLMMIYLFVSIILWCFMLMVSLYKISVACWKFSDSTRITDPVHKDVNMACTAGLFCFLNCVLYLFGFVVVFSFYHFRYVRRAIFLHEAQCLCS